MKNKVRITALHQKIPPFSEYCYTPENRDYISSGCTVESDDEGYFVRIVTDAHEGSAQMTLPTAKQVHAALGRLLRHVRDNRSRVNREQRLAARKE